MRIAAFATRKEGDWLPKESWRTAAMMTSDSAAIRTGRTFTGRL